MHKDAPTTIVGNPSPGEDLAVARVIGFVFRGEATSRAEIARRTGLARSTVSQQVDQLIGRGLLAEAPAETPARGRPPRRLIVDPRAGRIAVVDVDISDTRVAVADLSGRILAQDAVAVSVEGGPETVLELVEQRITALLAATGDDTIPLRQVVVGLPAPVDFRRGRAVRPPIMPGWDGYPVATHLRAKLAAPVLVDNDVNLATLAEAEQDYAETPLVVIKVSAGIGAGMVTWNGELHRGADGAAGDIGHIRTGDHDDVACRCGQNGCLEAVASLRAVMAGLGLAVTTTEEFRASMTVLKERIGVGDPETLRALWTASQAIGNVAACIIQLFNPRTLVLGGPLSSAADELLSGVRAAVYGRAVPLTTRHLTLTTSQLGVDAGIRGGIALALQEVWSPEGMLRILQEVP